MSDEETVRLAAEQLAAAQGIDLEEAERRVRLALMLPADETTVLGVVTPIEET